MVRGPVKGYAEGEVEVVEGGVGGNGEGAGYYWVGYFEKIHTEDEVVGLGTFRRGINVAGGHCKWSKCEYKSCFSCQGHLWSSRSENLLAYMREVVCLLIIMEGIEAEDFQCETRSERDVVGTAFEPTWAASSPNNGSSTKLFPPLHVEIGLAPFCAGALQ